MIHAFMLKNSGSPGSEQVLDSVEKKKDSRASHPTSKRKLASDSSLSLPANFPTVSGWFLGIRESASSGKSPQAKAEIIIGEGILKENVRIHFLPNKGPSSIPTI